MVNWCFGCVVISTGDANNSLPESTWPVIRTCLLTSQTICGLGRILHHHVLRVLSCTFMYFMYFMCTHVLSCTIILTLTYFRYHVCSSKVQYCCPLSCCIFLLKPLNCIVLKRSSITNSSFTLLATLLRRAPTLHHTITLRPFHYSLSLAYSLVMSASGIAPQMVSTMIPVTKYGSMFDAGLLSSK